MEADDGNPLVEAYDFFITNADLKQITLKEYLRNRNGVLRRLRKAVLGNPGYLGILLGILLGWTNAAGYIADTLLAALFRVTIQFRTDSYANILRALTGLVVLLAVWFISRHCVDTYRNDERRHEGDNHVSRDSGTTRGHSKIWVIISGILYCASSIAAGCSLYALFRSFDGVSTPNELFIMMIILVGTWLHSLRVCWLRNGVNGIKMPMGLFVVSLVLGMGAGYYFQLPGADTPFGTALEALALVGSMLSFAWFGFVGANLLEDDRAARRVSKHAGPSVSEKRTTAEWIRKDAPLWLINLALCTVALALLEVVGTMILATLGAIC